MSTIQEFVSREEPPKKHYSRGQTPYAVYLECPFLFVAGDTYTTACKDESILIEED
jgi:hypothetical protein